MAEAQERSPEDVTVYQDALVELYSEISKNVDWKNIKGGLYSQKVITKDEKENLIQTFKKSGNIAVIEDLLDLLEDKSLDDIKKFLKVLEHEGQTFVTSIRDKVDELQKKAEKEQSSQAEVKKQPANKVLVQDAGPQISEDEVISSVPKDLPTEAIKQLKDEKVYIMLLGKTGAGKSAHGNCIFQSNDFPSSGNPQSVTQICKKVTNKVLDQSIVLVDTPGLMDYNNQSPQDMNKATQDAALNELSTGIAMAPDGYHAFLIVVRYPARLTKEDMDCANMFVKAFGDEIRPYSIVVLTGGDTYRKQQTRSGNTINFEDFFDTFYNAKPQKEGDVNYFRQLFDMFTGGWILIDNFLTHPQDYNRQMSELLTLVKLVRIQTGDKKYKNEIFKAVQAKKKELKEARTVPPVECKQQLQVVAKEGLKEKTGGGCFPHTAQVTKYPGVCVPISSVRVGDHVLSAARDNSLFYDQVYSVVHEDASATMLTSRIITRSKTLTGSRTHFIPVTNSEGHIEHKVMSDVVPGDVVMVTHSTCTGDKMEEEKVTEVQNTVSKGQYNLLTDSGRLCVDGVLVTCYEKNVAPKYAHFLLGLIRLLFWICPRVLNAVSSVRYEGMPLWAYGSQVVVKRLRQVDNMSWILLLATIATLLVSVWIFV